MASIRFSAVNKRYGTTPSVSDLDLEIADHEFVVLLGPSGCGKSTTLNMIAGLEEITSGTLHFDDQLMNHVPVHRRDVAMVFQSYALYPHKTVFENIAFGLRMRRVPAADLARRVHDAAERLELTPLLQRRPGQLSGGQRQRVALGRAMVREPAVFLMDEPLSNLDAALRTQTRKEIVDLHRRAGVTTVYVTHDQVEAMTMSDRVALMQAGRILQLGTPRGLYDDPATIEVARFLGSPAINTLAAIASEHGATLEGIHLPIHPAAAPGAAVTIALRPESLRLSPNGLLPATVEHLEYLGAETLLHTRCAGKPLVARLATIQDLRPGETIRFAPDWTTALLFNAEGNRLQNRALAHV